MARLQEKVKEQSQKWQGTAVIASTKQEEFCRWLGFTVVGVYERPENMPPKGLKNLLSKKAAMIVGNHQSDWNAAVSLGKKLDLPVAILSNFPNVEGYGSGYEQLCLNNLNRLKKAWQNRQPDLSK